MVPWPVGTGPLWSSIVIPRVLALLDHYWRASIRVRVRLVDSEKARLTRPIPPDQISKPADTVHR